MDGRSSLRKETKGANERTGPGWRNLWGAVSTRLGFHSLTFTAEGEGALAETCWLRDDPGAMPPQRRCLDKHPVGVDTGHRQVYWGTSNLEKNGRLLAKMGKVFFQGSIQTLFLRTDSTHRCL